MTLAQAAQKAIELGGKYDGHELPEDINAFTKTSATALAGQGLMGVAQGQLSARRRSRSPFVAGFAEVEVDVETGKYHDRSTTPRSPTSARSSTRAASAGRCSAARCSASATRSARSGSTTSTTACRWRKRFYQNKPPTILDAPHEDAVGDAVDLPDPETPVGARGIGEPPVGAGYGAVLNAIADAVGDEVFRRAPVTLDMILTRSRTAAADARGADGAHLRSDLGLAEFRLMAISRISDQSASLKPALIRSIVWP